MFQAQAALAKTGKRLPTNAEWQMAVAGTPDDRGSDTTPCNTRSGFVQNTGANADCVSDWGAFDTFTTVQGPGALIRGGNYLIDSLAGPFAVVDFVTRAGARPAPTVLTISD